MNFEEVRDPLDVLESWRKAAEAAGATLPESMTLATVGLDGAPEARVVLWKGRREREIWFFTNYESQKARELEREPRAQLLVHHPKEALQARVSGRVQKLAPADSDAYFAVRPRLSQIGAWASSQSRELGARSELEARVREMEERFSGGPVPRPPHWGGYALTAETVELWVGQDGRLHDRARFRFDAGSWHFQLLWP